MPLCGNIGHVIDRRKEFDGTESLTAVRVQSYVLGTKQVQPGLMDGPGGNYVPMNNCVLFGGQFRVINTEGLVLMTLYQFPMLLEGVQYSTVQYSRLHGYIIVLLRTRSTTFKS
jgi:hypothetical protein